MKDTINFLLAGVGGQGTILASDVLVNVGLAAGYQAKQAEVHGMSQRGGSVTSFVRWGKVVYSPLVGAGEVDVLLAFEKVEALRSLRQLRPGALALVNMEAIEPVTVTSGDAVYPDDERLYAAVAQVTDQAAYIHGPELAAQVGNPSDRQRGAAGRPVCPDGTPGSRWPAGAGGHLALGDHRACPCQIC